MPRRRKITFKQWNALRHKSRRMRGQKWKRKFLLWNKKWNTKTFCSMIGRRRSWNKIIMNPNVSHFSFQCVLQRFPFWAGNDKVLNCLSGTFLPKKSDEIKTNWSEKLFRFLKGANLMNAHENYPFPHSLLPDLA